MNKIVILFIFIIISLSVIAQPQGKRPGGSIRGVIFDKDLDIPVEFATVALFRMVGTEPVNGAVSDEKGVFLLTKIRPGKYKLKFTFIGYYTDSLENIKVPPGKEIDLGKIFLQQAAENLKEVTVTSTISPVEYHIDRKVINVDKQHVSASETAVEILENIPSITVDIEGNVKLRGSSGFTVLLDGKPSILEPSDILNQIPASTIQSIEIITNPSAKFDPDGTAGIINIISKKRQQKGTTGMVNLNFGSKERYGGDFLLNHRTKKITLSLSADYNKRFFPGSRITERKTFFNDTTYFVNSDGNTSWGRSMKGIKAAIEYNFSKRDNFSLGFRYGGREMQRTSAHEYIEWTKPGDDENIYTSSGDWHIFLDFVGANLDYFHNFGMKGHSLTLQALYRQITTDEMSVDELLEPTGVISEGRKATESGPVRRMRFKADYTLPIGDNNKFEAGLQSRIGESIDTTGASAYNVNSGNYDLLPEYNSKTNYYRNIHSGYSIFSGKIKDFGYQTGLRVEYTDRLLTSDRQNSDVFLNRWDYFPTLHFSYLFPKEHQVMASYTRRIERPRGYNFEPFLTWLDAYNVRRGNPDLLPEYIDSYEIGYQKPFKNSFFSLEMYYRITNNKIERAHTAYSQNVVLHTFKNVGKDYSLGAEISLNLRPVKKWQTNIMTNLYHYKVEGIIFDRSFSEESFTWNARLNNSFSFNKKIDFQINGSYNSPTVSAQGSVSGYFTVNSAIKAYFFDKKLSFNLQARDLFSTAKHEHVTDVPNFYFYAMSKRDAPLFTLTVSYKINNYRPERKKRGNGSDMEGDDF